LGYFRIVGETVVGFFRLKSPEQICLPQTGSGVNDNPQFPRETISQVKVKNN